MRDFNHTIGVLVNAYLNDELEHSVCSACAVGNIVAAAIGTRPAKLSRSFVLFDNRIIRYDNWMFADGSVTEWQRVFMTCGDDQSITPGNYNGASRVQIDATGYSFEELANIEYAFETSDRGNSQDDWMFNGLMAVVDALAEIHGIDLTTREETKKLFSKPVAI